MLYCSRRSTHGYQARPSHAVRNIAFSIPHSAMEYRPSTRSLTGRDGSATLCPDAPVGTRANALQPYNQSQVRDSFSTNTIPLVDIPAHRRPRIASARRLLPNPQSSHQSRQKPQQSRLIKANQGKRQISHDHLTPAPRHRHSPFAPLRSILPWPGHQPCPFTASAPPRRAR